MIPWYEGLRVVIEFGTYLAPSYVQVAMAAIAYAAVEIATE